jgi:hypothetical protein
MRNLRIFVLRQTRMIKSRKIKWAVCNTHWNEWESVKSFDGEARRKETARKI